MEGLWFHLRNAIRISHCCRWKDLDAFIGDFAFRKNHLKGKSITEGLVTCSRAVAVGGSEGLRKYNANRAQVRVDDMFEQSSSDEEVEPTEHTGYDLLVPLDDNDVASDNEEVPTRVPVNTDKPEGVTRAIVPIQVGDTILPIQDVGRSTIPGPKASVPKAKAANPKASVPRAKAAAPKASVPKAKSIPVMQQQQRC